MESPDRTSNLFPWSDIVRYVAISAINLAILLVGLALGVMLAPHIEKPVSAQSTAPPQVATQPPISATAQADYEDITPQISAASMAANTFLAHRIAADQVMVNGYDVLALDEGILNTLKNKNLVTNREIDAIVERAKIPKPLRLKLPPQPVMPSPQPQSNNPKPEEKK